jgi:hypothetical protein
MFAPQHKPAFLSNKLMGWFPLAALLALALLLRLTGIDSRSFHNDELSALFRLQVENFSQLIEYSVTPDAHPALIQTFLFYWTKLTGFQPWIVRMPFAAAGVISVWLIYLLGKIWFGKGTAWLAAASFALLQFPVLYSQLARPYSSGVLIILALTWCWNGLLNPLPGSGLRTRLLYAAGMSITMALAMYNHYFSFLVAGMIGITGLFLLRKETIVPYILSGLAAMLLFLPHLNISIVQVARGGLALWLAPPGLSWLTHHALYLFNNSPILLTLALAISLPYLFRKPSSPARTRPVMQRIMLLWFLIPLAFAFFWSVFINPILQHSIMLFAFPFLLLALFSGYGNDNSHLTKGIVVIFPVVLLSHLLWGAGYYKTTHYTDFKSMGNKICHELSQPNTVWAADINDPWYIHYYVDQDCTNDSALFYLSGNRRDLSNVQDILDTLTADGLVYARLRPADPMVPELIMQYFPVLSYYRNDGLYGELFTFRKQLTEPAVIQNKKDTTSLKSIAINTKDHPDSFAEFIPLIELQIKNILPGSKYKPEMVRCVISNLNGNWAEEMHLVIEVTDRKGEVRNWSGFQPGMLHPVNGQYVVVSSLPEGLSRNDHLKVYLWNPKHLQIPLFSAELQAIGTQTSK